MGIWVEEAIGQGTGVLGEGIGGEEQEGVLLEGFVNGRLAKEELLVDVTIAIGKVIGRMNVLKGRVTYRKALKEDTWLLSALEVSKTI